MTTWDWRNAAPINCGSKTVRTMGHTLCSTSIAHHYSAPSASTDFTNTYFANRFDHELFHRSRHWWTIATDRYCRRWHNHPANHLDFVFGSAIQETMRNSPTHKQLHPTKATGYPESGIFGHRKGVMLRSFTISSYRLWTTFLFSHSNSAVRSLHHFIASSSLSPVIVHCTIHVFRLLWLIVYATHSIYLCSCTYISIDLSSSIESS